jgi:biotin synthase-related radical SAM superfamily protein
MKPEQGMNRNKVTEEERIVIRVSEKRRKLFHVSNTRICYEQIEYIGNMISDVITINYTTHHCTRQDILLSAGVWHGTM